MSQPITTSPDLIEAAFYDAFARCDVASMRSLWAANGCACIHPGAPALVGYEAVLRSWANILEGAQTPLIETRMLQRMNEPTMATHVLEEHIRSAAAPTQVSVVLVTNVYRLIDGVWRMVLHHGSLIATRPVEPRTLQ